MTLFYYTWHSTYSLHLAAIQLQQLPKKHKNILLFVKWSSFPVVGTSQMQLLWVSLHHPGQLFSHSSTYCHCSMIETIITLLYNPVNKYSLLYEILHLIVAPNQSRGSAPSIKWCHCFLIISASMRTKKKVKSTTASMWMCIFYTYHY